MHPHLRPACAVAALAVALTGAPVFAQTAAMSPAPMMTVDCTKAGSMMSAPDRTPATTGDVDKDFVAMAVMHQHAMMMLMTVEMKCGKDPRLKAAAAKQMQTSLTLMEMLQAQGQRY